MTGYGKAEAILEGGKLTVEFRSVNGKSADIAIKSSLLPKEHEMEIRKRIADRLQRGSIDMFITWEPNVADSAKQINSELALEYCRQIRELESKAGMNADDSAILAALLRMPDIIDTRKQDVVTAENWPLVSEAIDKALDAICAYRADEGVALHKDVSGRVQNILNLYDEVESHEAERIAAARERICKAAEELSVKLDPERLEQEMIFYLEKLDINEEKVRLRQHCKYFMNTLDGEPYPGKKLGFIIQEMGREINTTGSKANHAAIQQCVVRMKDELEKIREQSMNIL